MRAELAQLGRKKGEWFLGGRALVHEEFATDLYAWMDVLVWSPLHQALHRVLKAGLEKLPGGKKGMPKEVRHICILGFARSCVLEMDPLQQNLLGS